MSAYRVLDLTNEYGLLCGQMLADLGADVIQVEPRGGSSARAMGPWLDGERGPENSLHFAAYARNKRGLALDVARAADRERLLELVRGADFFIESERPGALAQHGLDYETLRDVQPSLVYVSITPFGQDGPKSQWAATDLTLVAAGGFSYLSGDADRAPLRVRVPQAYAQAGADAAVGALIAHTERRRTGLGQHVDVSMQQSVTLATMFRSLDGPVEMAPAQRLAGALHAGGVVIPLRHALIDGWVTLGPSILPSTGHFMKRLLEWVAEEGFCGSGLADEEDWGTFGLRIGAGKLPSDAYERVSDALDAFFATKSKAEIMQAAVARRLLIAPVLEIGDLIESPQLANREFAVALERSAGASGRYPGPFAKFAASPIRYRLPAPSLDQHRAALQAEAPREPAPCGAEAPGAAPLAGVKIVDLFWVLAGPTSTRMLADYGATVVRVESARHLDTLRMSPPWQFNTPHPEGGVGFQSANANKLGLALDLSCDEGREVLLDLLGWADVLTESFAPGVMDGMGLGYEALRGVRPDLVMLSSCIMGQTGPWRGFSGFGRLAVSIAGFQQLASWPGQPPSGPFGAYTDAIASRYNAAAILAALEHRSRTGEGQHIDLSQIEASLHFLAPAFLDWTLNGTAQTAAGNDDPDLFPHGVFPAAGDDRWIAIAVRDDRDWLELCAEMQRPDLIGRRGERSVVDQAIEAWTKPRLAEEMEAALQLRGVPAHQVLDTLALFGDAQLQHRGHFIDIDHDIYPHTTIESSRLHLSRAPARHPDGALTLGRDNRYVLETLLGYDTDRIAALADKGVLS